MQIAGFGVGLVYLAEWSKSPVLPSGSTVAHSSLGGRKGKGGREKKG